MDFIVNVSNRHPTVCCRNIEIAMKQRDNAWKYFIIKVTYHFQFEFAQHDPDRQSIIAPDPAQVDATILRQICSQQHIKL